MNAMMLVSHRLFAAALAENSDVRRPRPRSGKPVIIEVAVREAAPSWRKENPTRSRSARFDSQLHV